MLGDDTSASATWAGNARELEAYEDLALSSAQYAATESNREPIDEEFVDAGWRPGIWCCRQSGRRARIYDLLLLKRIASRVIATTPALPDRR